MKNLQNLGSLSNLGNPSGGGLNYILNDQFLTDIVAGSINGTQAQPKGGTRTITDTNTKISISSGLLTFATGQAANDGIWWSSLTRIIGRTFLLTINSTQGRIVFGFDNNNSGGINSQPYQYRDTNLIPNAGSTLIVGTLANSTVYQNAIVLRSTGGYWFIKGGAFTNWTLLWQDLQQNTATVFPVVISNTTTSIFTVDNARIPSVTWIPQPLAYDTFTRADGVLGNTEVAGPDAQTTPALAWTSTLGTWAVATNKAAASATSGGSAFATVNTSNADILIDANLTRSAGVVGVVLRYANSSNYIIAYHDGTNAKLDKVIGGSTTNVISAVATYSAGATLRVIASGSSFRLFYNNASVGSAGTINDAAVQTTTVHGLYTTDTGATFDNFQIFPRGTSNEYGTLDRF